MACLQYNRQPSEPVGVIVDNKF